MVTAYAAEEKRERTTVADANFMITAGSLAFLLKIGIGFELSKRREAKD